MKKRILILINREEYARVSEENRELKQRVKSLESDLSKFREYFAKSDVIIGSYEKMALERLQHEAARLRALGLKVNYVGKLDKEKYIHRVGPTLKTNYE